MSYTHTATVPPCDTYDTAPPLEFTDGQYHRTVLLVDDDTTILTLLSAAMKSFGHKVIIAHDGPEALSALRRHPTIDCLFSDVVMPNGMTGLQLTQTVRAMRPGLPALLASAYSPEQVRALGEIPEGVTFITKPYRLTDLYPLLDGGPVHRQSCDRSARQRTPRAGRKQKTQA